MLTSRLPSFSSLLSSADPLQWGLQLGDSTRAVSQRQQGKCPPHAVPSSQDRSIRLVRVTGCLRIWVGERGQSQSLLRVERAKLPFQTSVSLWVFIPTAALVDPAALKSGPSPYSSSLKGNLQMKHRYIFLSSRLRYTDHLHHGDCPLPAPLEQDTGI